MQISRATTTPVRGRGRGGISVRSGSILPNPRNDEDGNDDRVDENEEVAGAAAKVVAEAATAEDPVAVAAVLDPKTARAHVELHISTSDICRSRRQDIIGVILLPSRESKRKGGAEKKG